jgi:hypothetical protein
MPPKARGGGKKGPPPPSYTETDVSEFRAVTGCDSDAAARRSLAATRGDVSEAIIRYLEVHASSPKASPRRRYRRGLAGRAASRPICTSPSVSAWTEKTYTTQPRGPQPSSLISQPRWARRDRTKTGGSRRSPRSSRHRRRPRTRRKDGRGRSCPSRVPTRVPTYSKTRSSRRTRVA